MCLPSTFFCMYHNAQLVQACFWRDMRSFSMFLLWFLSLGLDVFVIFGMNSLHGLCQEYSLMGVRKTKDLFGYWGLQCDVNEQSSLEVIKENWFPSAEDVPAPCWKRSSSSLFAAQGGSVRTRLCVLLLPLLQACFSPQNQENSSACFVFRAPNAQHAECAGAGVSCCLGVIIRKF